MRARSVLFLQLEHLIVAGIGHVDGAVDEGHIVALRVREEIHEAWLARFAGCQLVVDGGEGR